MEFTYWKLSKNISNWKVSKVNKIENLEKIIKNNMTGINKSNCFYRSCQWWNGLFQSPQSVGWDTYHAWRLSRLWIRWHWSSLPEILSCHQRAFKSDENTGKFTKRNGWPLFPLCWVLLAFDVLFQETFYVAVQVREHSIAFLEMKNFFFSKVG